MTDSEMDALELELRRLPGVSFVAFGERENEILVQLLAAGLGDSDDLRDRAAHICRAHLDVPVTIEVDTGPVRTPVPGERVELLAVLASPDGREVEVHLAYGGQRTIGRGEIGGGPSQAATATLDALRQFRLGVPFTVLSASSGINGTAGDAVVVVLASTTPPGSRRFGVSAGANAHEAAAHAALDALNRFLALERPVSSVSAGPSSGG